MLVQSWLPSLLIAIAAVITVGATIFSARTAAFVARTSARRSEVENLAEMLDQYRLDNLDLRKQVGEHETLGKQLRAASEADKITIVRLNATVQDQNARHAEAEKEYQENIRVLTEQVDKSAARISALEHENAEQKIVMDEQARQIIDQAQKLADQSQQLAASAIDISTQARKLSEQAGLLAEKDRLIVQQAHAMAELQERLAVLEARSQNHTPDATS